MRKLYWKIFFSFWLTTILIIASTAWITSDVSKNATISIPVRLMIAFLISGLFCYWLSTYLTKPLHSVGMAAKSLATGKLDTRVGHLSGHNKDEIDELSHEFDSMAEQLETLIISKQRLLQDISHELRSPLARIQVAIELARKKSEQTAEKEFNRIEKECERLNTLISEVIEFARLDKSTSTLNKSRIDLIAFVENILLDANFEFSKKSPRVTFGHIEPCRIKIDKRLMHRAIENILRNALRYSPDDQPVVISIYKNKLNQAVYLDIEDSGPGVAENHLARIFDPFYRVETSREKKAGGYGLGLAIAKQAIQLHDGDIQAVNRQTGGLLMRIILPM